ncbi:MAG TPA: ATP-binding protein [Candidatus Dormibacteraeota bacterium]|nr:ATP-binding protein [Candidatus Dormibacteraeota bacterium]
MSARPSIRARLALVYGGAFFGMGLVLMAVSYLIVDHSLSPAATSSTVARFVGSVPPGALPFPPGVPPPGRLIVSTGGEIGGGAGAGQAGVALQTLIGDVRVQTLRRLLWAWVAVVALLGLAAGVGGWLLAGRMLRPLRDITGTARRLSVANLHERIGLEGPRDELKELADTFDGMLGRLDDAFASQRRFVANASHELRTPLAIMHTQIDVALGDPGVSRTELLGTTRVVRDAVERCERLLDGLLVLARSDRGLDAAEPVDLSESARRALEAVAEVAAERDIALRPALGTAVVRGDRALLDRLVANLVENAVAYNRPAGWVEVTTANGGSTARVRVANSGPPVPEDAVPALFEPFRRLSRERTGSGRGAGLGLSIVRSVARAHGGDAVARPLPEGGLAIEVDLPV